MAKQTIPAQEILTDDFTGKTLTKDDSPVTVKVQVNGKTFELDAAKAMADRFGAFLTEPSDETRRALGDVIPRNSVSSGSSKAKETDKAGTDKRTWLRGNGFPDVKDRGQFSPAMTEAWEKHLAAEK